MNLLKHQITAMSAIRFFFWQRFESLLQLKVNNTWKRLSAFSLIKPGFCNKIVDYILTFCSAPFSFECFQCLMQHKIQYILFKSTSVSGQSTHWWGALKEHWTPERVSKCCSWVRLLGFEIGNPTAVSHTFAVERWNTVGKGGMERDWDFGFLNTLMQLLAY